MNRTRAILCAIGAMVLLGALVAYFVAFPSRAFERDGVQHVAGFLWTDAVWKGEVLVEGDVIVPPWVTLTVLPGTRVRMAVGDQTPSMFDEEVPPDGFNDQDPSRTKAYADTHVGIFAAGRVLAEGTPEKPIVFTSAAENPRYADWVALHVEGGSRIRYARVEYARNGIDAAGDPFIEDNYIAHALWGCLSVRKSSALVRNNVVEDCGHEGVDAGSGVQVVNNTVKDSHAGILVLFGSPRIEGNHVPAEVDVLPGATPEIKNNNVDASLACRPGKEWAYLNYRIPCGGTPYLK